MLSRAARLPSGGSRDRGGTLVPGPLREFRAAVKADHDLVCSTVAKYGSARGQAGGLLGDLVRKAGFQLIFAYRVMRLLVCMRVPLLPEVAARAIRHLYGADIHPLAELSPGIMVVHGMGLCVSHGARVASGVILFQNVTLGEGIDPETREVGAPHIEAGVHVGPGATLLGPITVGEGSKIMAGCVVMRSVPAGSLVEAPAPTVRPRVRDQNAGPSPSPDEAAP